MSRGDVGGRRATARPLLTIRLGIWGCQPGFLQSVIFATVDEPFVLATVDEPFVLASVDEPLVLASIDGPFVLASVDEPFVLASVDEPLVLASIDEPLVPASVDEPFVLASVDEPFLLASIDEPFLLEPRVLEPRVLEPRVLEPFVVAPFRPRFDGVGRSYDALLSAEQRSSLERSQLPEAERLLAPDVFPRVVLEHLGLRIVAGLVSGRRFRPPHGWQFFGPW